MSEKQDNEHGIEEAKMLLEDLFNPFYITRYNLTPRELDIVKMKRKYKLSYKQIAEKLNISEQRVKEVYKKILYVLFSRIKSSLMNNPTFESLKKENDTLRRENEAYRIKFENLNQTDKEKYKALDVVMQSIDDTELSSRTKRALLQIDVSTVHDLLQYRLSSLLLMSPFSISIVEEIEIFINKNRLKIKK